MDPVTLQLLIVAGSMAWAHFNKPPKEPPLRKVEYPRTDEGAPIPLIYGKCRVRAPILAWVSDPHNSAVDDLASVIGVGVGTYVYGADSFWVVGAPFDGGTAQVHSAWIGDVKCTNNTPAPTSVLLADLDADNGASSDICTIRGPGAGGGPFEATVHLLDGRPTQTLIGPGPSYTPTTFSGGIMVAKGVDPARIGGRRGIACIMLTTYPYTSAFFVDQGLYADEYPLSGSMLGTSPIIPTFNFEMSSGSQLPLGSGLAVIDSGDGNVEANPIDVLRDLLCGKRKLAIPTAYVDLAGTFATAATTLAGENHGYSYAALGNPFEVIADLMQQIHGVLWWEPTTNLLKVKLIRSGASVAVALTPDNVVSLDDYEVIGNVDPITSLTVLFEDRSRSYNERPAVATNLAAATVRGRDNPVEMRCMGVKTEQLAAKIAARQLSFLSRTMIKCRLTVNRDAVRVEPGDVVTLTWPEYNLAEIRFRVFPTNRGTLTNNAIQLTLVQDQPETELPSFPELVLA